MKIEGSYTVRGKKISHYCSHPEPNVKSFDEVGKFVTWILGRENAKVEITK